MSKVNFILIILLLIPFNAFCDNTEGGWRASELLSSSIRDGKYIVYGNAELADVSILEKLHNNREADKFGLNISKFKVSKSLHGSLTLPSEFHVATRVIETIDFYHQSHAEPSGESERTIYNEPFFSSTSNNWLVILDSPFGEVDAVINDLQLASPSEDIYQISKGIGAFKIVKKVGDIEYSSKLTLEEFADLEKILLRRNSGEKMSQEFISTLATSFGKNLARELVDPGCGNGFLDVAEQCDESLFRDVDITQHGADNLECNNCVLSVKEYCGNGSCDASTENSTNCPTDCNCISKPCETDGSYNCSVTLVANQCVINCDSCPAVVCGDGVCSKNAGEDINTCAKDCGCPKVTCPKGETGSCSSTYNDYTDMCDPACTCTPIITSPVVECGNNQCESGEDCKTCQLDCGECPSECGDKICSCNHLSPYLISAPCVKGSSGECDQASAEVCLAESIKICESSSVSCIMGEATINGQYKDRQCVYDTSTCMTTNIPSSCGNAICDSDENCESCSSDCGLCVESPPSNYCGNNSCDNGEDCTSCPIDCGTCVNTEGYCGDGMCSVEEQNNWYSCQTDCNYNNSGLTVAACGNGSCEAGEDCTNCQIDCGSCTITEDANTGGFCGDGGCDSSTENCTTCPADCGEC